MSPLDLRAPAISLRLYVPAPLMFRRRAADPPDCALVDLNLGLGMCFEVARELSRRAIPVAFVTGYDHTAIPDKFVATPRMEKPVAAQQAGMIAEQLLAAQRT